MRSPPDMSAHRLQAFAADQPDRSDRPGDSLTAGALITEVVLTGGGGSDEAGKAVACACADTCGGVAGIYTAHFNVPKFVMEQEPFQQKVGGLRVAPSVFLSPGAEQPVCFGLFLEHFGMVCTSPTTVLHIKNNVIIHMYHFVEQGGCNGLQRTVESAGGYIYLPAVCVLE